MWHTAFARKRAESAPIRARTWLVRFQLTQGWNAPAHGWPIEVFAIEGHTAGQERRLALFAWRLATFVTETS
jgi:hypothetical protein